MRRSLPRTVSGEKVRIALMEVRPGGLTFSQLVVATGLSPSQVRSGLIHLKQVAALAQLTPLTWTARDGYRFSNDAADWVAYERAQFRTQLNRVSNLLTGTINPHKARMPEDEWVQLVIDQLTGVKAALALLGRST